MNALMKPRGSPAWDGLLRVSGLIGLLGIPLVLLVPAAGGLVGFVLASVWVHGPASPFLPATFEPLLILFGRLYPPILLALIGTAANLAAEYLNYQLCGELLAQGALKRVTQQPWLARLVRHFNRRPFLITWLISWSPVPDWTIRIMGPLSRYPVGRWLAAIALGRLPRFWLLASIGTWVDLDFQIIAWIAVIPATMVVVGLIRIKLRRHRAPVPVVTIPTATTVRF